MRRAIPNLLLTASMHSMDANDLELVMGWLREESTTYTAAGCGNLQEKLRRATGRTIAQIIKLPQINRGQVQYICPAIIFSKFDQQPTRFQ